MVVDDEVENVRIFESLLTTAGCRVRAFPNGSLALAAARQEPPELLLLDIRMPDMDGYEVYRQFQAVPNLRTVPVIFVSALNESADVVRGFQVGGADYVAKPIREEELLARVRLHLALRRQQRELELRNRELDRQYRQLESLERLRNDWVHMLVHDLRSPLQGVTLLLQYLIDLAGTLPEAEQRSQLREIFETTRRMGRMLQTVLDVSRLEVGKLPLRREALDAQDLIQEAVRTLGGLVQGRDLRVEIAEPPVVVSGDRDLCVRVLANLLDNALKYTPAGKPVVVGARAEPRGACLWVRDQGPGIAPADQRRVFRKFAGVRTSRSPMPVNGLGLAFCRLAVLAHGGTIRVASTLGEGSTFALTIPKNREMNEHEQNSDRR